MDPLPETRIHEDREPPDAQMRLFHFVLCLPAVTATAVAIPGHDTTYTIIKSAPAGAAIVATSDRVTVHATGIVEETGKKCAAFPLQPIHCQPCQTRAPITAE